MRRYQNILKEHGIKQSMSRKGNCLDNAVVECFFGTLKSECFYLDEFSNISELKDAVTEYIEYYNSRRISLKLGNDSNLLIVFYVQIMPDDFVMQLHRF